MNFCNKCGKSIPWYDNYCSICIHTVSEAEKEIEVDQEEIVEGVGDLLDKTVPDSIPNIEKGDRIWFRNPQDTVIERYVHEVKNKVFGVGSKPKSRGYNTYWYEFNNVDIIEVEKDEP